MDAERMRVLVLVKAAPVLTQHLDETMCVAGARLDGDQPEWVRLHPVPFRDLEDDSKFVKYQVVNLDAYRPSTDRRPESWSPRRASIVLGERLGSGDGWAQRSEVIRRLPEHHMCDLVRLNRAGSGSGTPSFVPFLSFDSEVRAVIYTTNAIESINARIRKAVKARGHFPTETAAFKCVYLAIMSLDPTGRGRQRWTNRWKPALNAFTIAFPGRIIPSTK